MGTQPIVSIVTPSFNTGRFIQETIESVLSQDYQNVEYIVMDAGSTDSTLSILERYRDRLQYVSQPDNGTADAVNRGFARSSGSILAWLSADDVLLPGAVGAVVRSFLDHPDADVVYGEGYWIDEKGAVLARYPTVAPYDPAMLAQECCICQPSCFMRRGAYLAVGGLDASLHSAFDYDLWVRLSRRCLFLAVPEFLATSRMHKDNISLGQRQLMFEESIAVLQRHYGYVPVNWIYGYLSYRHDGADQFFEPLRVSPLVGVESLLVGSFQNRRRLLRYWREYASKLARQTRRACGL